MFVKHCMWNHYSLFANDLLKVKGVILLIPAGLTHPNILMAAVLVHPSTFWATNNVTDACFCHHFIRIKTSELLDCHECFCRPSWSPEGESDRLPWCWLLLWRQNNMFVVFGVMSWQMLHELANIEFCFRENVFVFSSYWIMFVEYHKW